MNGVVVLVFLFAGISSVVGDCYHGFADAVVAVPGSLEDASTNQIEWLDGLVTHILSQLFGITNFHTDLILYGKEGEEINLENFYGPIQKINFSSTLAHQRVLLHPSIGGGRNVPKVIRKVHDHLITAGRPGLTKIGVIFTYGSQDLSSPISSEVSQQVSEASTRARDDGINIVVVSANGTTPGIPNTDICRAILSVETAGLFHFYDMIGYILQPICYAVDSFLNPTPGTCFINGCEPNKEDPEEKFQCNPGDSFVADPTDCSYYYWCPMGTRMKCAPGTLFDPNIKRCNHKDFVTCNSGLQCPSPSGLFAHPSDCNQFLSCSENIPCVQQCPVGLVFNPSKLYCDYEENVPECGHP